ncbi:hypothetical protein GH714_017998 [Hevea brasiliensis]|uniref:Fungal lipase-type domain-containing protein n=1 Tax=Hevea brasiliensis TaxID=3981 RepID=A0A6A6LHF0_HEVBR|nr:hypothetical protein GH714_017998 [Hevea brasiliensis]
MFPAVLEIQDEVDFLQRMLNVYTFGRPRIEDNNLFKFMESHLNYPFTKYFRVVYCNNLVPRVPFDASICHYKHFGEYWRRGAKPKFLWFEINHPKFPMHLNAIYELFRSFLPPIIYGKEYKETWASKSFRVMGILPPGIAGHSPVEYVNSVKLGSAKDSAVPTLRNITRRP